MVKKHVQRVSENCVACTSSIAFPFIYCSNHVGLPPRQANNYTVRQLSVSWKWHASMTLIAQCSAGKRWKKFDTHHSYRITRWFYCQFLASLARIHHATEALKWNSQCLESAFKKKGAFSLDLSVPKQRQYIKETFKKRRGKTKKGRNCLAMEVASWCGMLINNPIQLRNEGLHPFCTRLIKN